jgi:hypothetical protein
MPAFQKGHKKVGGRKRGSRNKLKPFAVQVAEAAAEMNMMPREYMLAVMRDPIVPADRRDRMAAAVAPYIHPRLAIVAATVETTDQPPRFTREELDARAKAIIGDAFREYEPPRHEEPRIPGPVIEPPSSPVPNAEPAASREEPLPSSPREYARPGGLTIDDRVTRLQPRYRPPRPVGSGWGV